MPGVRGTQEFLNQHEAGAEKHRNRILLTDFFPPYFRQHVNLLDHLMYDSPKFYSLNARVFWGFQRVWRGINGLQGGLHKHTYTARVPVNPVMGGRGRVDAGPESAGWGGW